MHEWIWICFGISFLALLVAVLVERSAILARINGANGMIILVFLIGSFLASLVVAVIAGILGGWHYLWGVLGGTLAYHGAMGVATIGYLQELATQTASRFKAREAASRLAQSIRFSKKKAWGLYNPRQQRFPTR